MVRRHAAFVGIRSDPSEVPETVFQRVQAAYQKYLRFRNAREAADELIRIMEANRRIAPLILATIEKVAKADREFMQEQLVRANLGRRPADPGLEVHFLDLDWMTTIPDYSSVAVLYRQGHDQPTDLEVMVARMREKTAERFAPVGRKERRGHFETSREAWEKLVGKFELSDLIMVTSLIPEALVDEVIGDQDRVSNFGRRLDDYW
jgi:hypothetical protein